MVSKRAKQFSQLVGSAYEEEKDSTKNEELVLNSNKGKGSKII